MATELGNAYVQIVPSAKGIKGKIKEVLEPEAKSAGQSSGETLGAQIADFAKKAITAAGIGKAIKEALSEGAALQQSMGGVETLFKGSADTVIQNAKQAFRTVGVSANEYMENVTSFSASLLQSLGGDTQKAASVADMAMVDMADNANKMGTDMSSIQNAYQGFAKQTYTMLDNLKLGYGGTGSEMEHLLADAQKLTGVKYDIENLSDVYEAIHVIQEDLDITGTTAKEASETFSGSFAAMSAAAKDLMGSLTLGDYAAFAGSSSALLGTAKTFVFDNFLPMLGNLLTQAPEIIISMITGMGYALKDHVGDLVEGGVEIVRAIIGGIGSAIPDLLGLAIDTGAELAKALGDVDWPSMGQEIIGFLKGSLSDRLAENGIGIELISDIANGIKTGLPELLTAAYDIVSGIATGILNNLPEFASTAGEIIGSIAGFIISLIPDLLETGGEIVGQIAQGIIDAIPTIVGAAGDLVAGFATAIGEAVPELQPFTDILAALGEHFEELTPLIVGIVAAIAGFKAVGIVSGIISGIAGTISTLSGVVSGLFTMLAANPIGLIVAAIAGVVAGLTYLWNNCEGFRNFVTEAWEGLKGFVDWLSEGFAGVGEFISGVFEGIKEAVTGAWDAIMNSELVQSIIQGWQEKFEGFKETLSKVWDGIKTAASGAWNLIKTVVLGPVILLIDLLTGNFTKFKEDLGKIWDNIKTAASNIWNGIKSAVSAIVTKFVDGMKEKFNKFKENLGTIWSNVKTAASEKWNSIKSSVTDIAHNLAEDTKGKIDGLKENLSKSWDSMKDTSKNTWDNVKSTAADLVGSMKTTLQNDLDEMAAAYEEHGGGLEGTAAALWKGLQDAYTFGFDTLNELSNGKLGEIKDAFFNKFTDIIDSAKEWGKDIIQGLADGISEKVQAVKDAASNVAESIREFLHFSEPDVGPLSDFHTYMPDMMRELVSGMLAAIPTLEDASRRVAEAILPAISLMEFPVINAQGAGNGQMVTINVYQRDGEDGEALARRISDILYRDYYRKGAAFA